MSQIVAAARSRGELGEGARERGANHHRRRDRGSLQPRLRAGLACASILYAIAAGPAVPAEPAEPGFVTITPDAVEWQRAGEEGIEFAVLAGNPNAAGLYILRVRFPAGVMSRPHTHDRDRFITVIEGTWHAGTQAEFDPAATTPLGPGSFMVHPAGAVHYDGARETATIVEIRGIGPVSTTYLPAEATTP